MLLCVVVKGRPEVAEAMAEEYGRAALAGTEAIYLMTAGTGVMWIGALDTIYNADSYKFISVDELLRGEEPHEYNYRS